MNKTYETFIAKSRYARFLPEQNRRENWNETVERYFNFMENHLQTKLNYKIPKQTLKELKHYIQTQQILPSMRSIMTAGEALARNNTAGYNCSYLPVDDPKSFDEAMFILLCGTGVGFSVERQYVNKLPEIPEKIYESDSCVVVSDSKEGWAKALRQLIALLYSGEAPKWDTSKIRPAGARLKTFGGRASGPEPLIDLFKFVVKIFKGAQGRKLNSLECHDIMCKIGEVVVVGGVRRSAMISLSNLSDERMRHAKSGAWWEANSQRALANNSICFSEKPEVGVFMKEWLALYESKSGERGLFNRAAAINIAKKNGRRDIDYAFGTNPCSEIILRPYQFCNLSTVIVRPEDTVEDLIKKAKLATKLGTYQSTLTHFPYLRKVWKDNTEEERLLGVSMTGALDNHLFNNPDDPELPERLQKIKEAVVLENKELAEEMGIPQSTATTAIKPEGCHTKDTMIVTDKGIKTIEEILKETKDFNGDNWAEVKTDLYAIGNNDKISKVYKNGIKQVLKIKTQYGFEQTCTLNHPWFVVEKGWVEAKDLKISDILEIDTSPKLKNNVVLLKKINQEILHNAIVINQPDVFCNDLAYLIGFYFANGSIDMSSNYICFYSGHFNVLTKITDIIKDKFGIQVNIKKDKTKEMYQIKFKSKNLVNFLKENDLLKYDDLSKEFKIIPQLIRSSLDLSIGFFAGLIDGDGCVTINGNNKIFKISTKHEHFANSIQDLALACGILLTKSFRSKETLKKYVEYDCTLQSTTIVDSTIFQLLIKNSLKIANNNNNNLAWRHDGERTNKFYIKSLELLDKEVETFGIEVENSHWYYAGGGIKSHNTTSQLTDSASGLHPRHSQYYFRRVRGDIKDPLTKFMIDAGVPNEPCVMKPDSTVVFTFAKKAPDGALLRKNLSALQHLKLWLVYQRNYCEHKPSVTISVSENEWVSVGAFVWEHFDELSGVSFLPYDGGSYKQAPYEECTEQEYLDLIAKIPENINWDSLNENDDNVEGAQMLACTGGVCEI